MGFWERVKKDLQQAMREGAHLVKEGTATLTAKASRVAKKGATSMRTEARRMSTMGKLRYQIFRLNQKAQSNFTEIGGQVYDIFSRDPGSIKLDEKLEKLMKDTHQIEDQLKGLRAEIERISRGKKEGSA